MNRYIVNMATSILEVSHLILAPAASLSWFPHIGNDFLKSVRLRSHHSFFSCLPRYSLFN